VEKIRQLNHSKNNSACTCSPGSEVDILKDGKLDFDDGGWRNSITSWPRVAQPLRPGRGTRRP